MEQRDPGANGRPEPSGPGVGALIALGALGLLVVLGVLLGAVTDGWWIDQTSLAQRVRALGAWGPVAVVLLMILHSFVPFPAEILALAAGAAYGTLWGSVLIWTGAMLGASVAFGIARWLGRRAVERLLSARHRARLDAWTDDQGAMTLLVSRFIPVIAFNLINYAAGLTRVGWGTFLWTTGVGILPLTVLMVWLGARMATLSWPAILAVSAAGIGAVLILHWVAKRHGWI